MEKKKKFHHLDQFTLNKTISHLSLLFDRATNSSRLSKINKGSKIYQSQVDFSYLIDEIQRGPLCFQQKNISKCYDYISSLNTTQTKT